MKDGCREPLTICSCQLGARSPAVAGVANSAVGMITPASEILKGRQVGALQSASREYPCHQCHPPAVPEPRAKAGGRLFPLIRVYSCPFVVKKRFEDFRELRPANPVENIERKIQPRMDANQKRENHVERRWADSSFDTRHSPHIRAIRG